MHAGNAEHTFDAVAFEQADEGFATGAVAGLGRFGRGRAGLGDADKRFRMVHGS
ncbi:hypothetical protein BST28156_00608 [Burkholderia stagnalis]|nr:hypothetical protein BST28156_00608 [Burkholderia stagnalis]